jgi:hypothetical protein
MFELYDLLITVYEDLYVAPPINFQVVLGQPRYDLPNGSNVFNSAALTPVTPPGLYKLMGVDLSLNTASNAWVTVNKFVFNNRNEYVYPNTASTIYGVFNLRYRLLGNQIEFIPTPSSGQRIQLWYIPKLTQLISDTDITVTGISGWLEYVITDAAIKVLQKEESDVTILGAQKMALIRRIQESAMNRDVAQPDHITDIRSNGQWPGSDWNSGFPSGGF